MSPNEREHLVLEGWKANDVFRRSVEERGADKIFSFYEGPPTVNGVPGIHHVFSRTLKDTICRYKTMRGYRVERKAGWDTHGLPVEIAIEKELGFRHKSEIEGYGVDKFNELCRRSVYDHISRDGGWNELTERMAYWVDLKHPYITCSNEYIESVWWALKQFHDKGLIYKGYKIQPYCPRCETPLSSHEVALGYKQAKDPSVFVKFRRVQRSANSDQRSGVDEYFLAWTTTPWTLISNVALAVHPDVEYVTVVNKRKDREPERLVLAKALLSKLEGDVEIVDEFLGKTLEGAEYERLFDFVPVEAKAFYIVLGNYVTTEDGTGIVHTAPAFGEDDFQVSKKYGLPVVNPVDKTGSFTPIVTELAGQFVKEADPAIVENLKRRGLLYRKETIEHTYPFCWRCDSPLLYYARDSWYIRVTDYRDTLVSENKTVNWNPPEIGEGRFGNWLEELKDWGISRERFWGTPLPLWVSVDDSFRPERPLCIGRFDDLKLAHEVDGELRIEHEKGAGYESSFFKAGRFVFEPWIIDDNGGATRLTTLESFDPHKPLVDKIVFREKEGRAELRRTPEVIDVWFDSGSMPFAQFHYPFENKDAFDRCYPAQYISEGVDQTRGWFYTLASINTFLFGKIPYENVIVNDMLLDRNGQKMSKSRGNVVNPFDVITKHGADATRWYLMAAAVPWKPRAFNEDDLAEVERKLFGTLTNTYGFFALYANIDGYAYDESKTIPVKARPEIDRWVLSKLNSLVKTCTEAMEDYDLTRGTRAIQDFVSEQVSNWYVRRNRRRFWKGTLAGNADKQAAYDTLHECLTTIAKLMAPYAPYFPDWLYSALQGSANGALKGSVHLALYPETNNALIDEKLEKRMEAAQIASSLVRQMRERAKLKVRQPLERILIPVANRYESEELRKVEDVIREEVNVKRVEYVESGDSDVIKLRAKANFKVLGAKLGKSMKSAAARIGKLSQEEIREFQQRGELSLDVDGQQIRFERGDFDVIAEDVEGWLVSSEGGLTVALDTHLTAALLQEGMAREFVNRVQNLRKDSGFDVTDRIAIAVATSSNDLRGAITGHADYIRQETLAEALQLDGAAPGEAASAEVEINDEKATIALSRV